MPWNQDNRAENMSESGFWFPVSWSLATKSFLGKPTISVWGARFDAGLEPDLPNQVIEDYGDLHLLLPEIEIVIHSKILRASSTYVALQFTSENPKKTMKILEDFLETQVSYINS